MRPLYFFSSRSTWFFNWVVYLLCSDILSVYSIFILRWCMFNFHSAVLYVQPINLFQGQLWHLHRATFRWILQAASHSLPQVLWAVKNKLTETRSNSWVAISNLWGVWLLDLEAEVIREITIFPWDFWFWRYKLSYYFSNICSRSWKNGQNEKTIGNIVFA